MTAIPGSPILRYGIIMMPQPGNPLEVEGTLNPAGTVGRDGQFYLLPRLVSKGNYSRIGLCRVTRHPDGRPAGVRRLGVVLTPYKEGNPHAPLPQLAEDERGTEDARVQFVPLLSQYAMAYTALGHQGPRVALAWSRDLRVWRKTGLVRFAEEESCPGLQDRHNKDAIFMPRPVRGPTGRPSWALIHRPRTPERSFGIWVSYLDVAARDLTFRHHRPLAWPQQSWEALRIGAGSLTEIAAGFLLLYHGVEPTETLTGHTYHAGAMLLDRDDPSQVLQRTTEPVFSPRLKMERFGVVNSVVFPTAMHQRAGGIDAYYGAADSRIGCARLGCTPYLSA